MEKAHRRDTSESGLGLKLAWIFMAVSFIMSIFRNVEMNFIFNFSGYKIIK